LTGAILRREFVVPGRKLHTFLVRFGYGSLLAVMFGIVFLFHISFTSRSVSIGASIRAITQSAERLAFALAVLNVLGCLVFTPAYVAGSISQEKDQRTMQDLLLTSMSSLEIVLSKLVGRVAQVMMVLATSLPLVVIGRLLGGISGSMVLALAAMTTLWVITAGSFTMFISVLTRRTRDAIAGSYLFGAALLAGLAGLNYWLPASWYWFRTVLDAFDPFRVLGPAWAGASAITTWTIIGETTLVLGLFSAALVGLTVWRLRPLGVRQLEVVAPKGKRLWKSRVRQAPGDTPMLWKERYFLSTGRIARLLYLLSMSAAVVMAVMIGVWVCIWLQKGFTESGRSFFFEGETWFLIPRFLGWPVYLSLLLTSSSAFSNERERSTWDAILTCPLEAREIVSGKLLGSLWDIRWWLIAIALATLQLVVFTVAAPSDSLTPFGWTSNKAVVLLMLFTGALGINPGVIGLVGETLFILGVGLRTSLACKTSGRALAITLMIWIGAGVAYWVLWLVGWVMFLVFQAFLFRGRGSRPHGWCQSASSSHNKLAGWCRLPLGCFGAV